MYEKGDLSDVNYQQTLDETLAAFRKQAAPFIVQKKISPERLELIIKKLIEQ